MQKNKNTYLFLALLLSLSFGQLAFAEGNDLTIKVKSKNADLMGETKISDLKEELRLQQEVRKSKNQLAFGASVFNLGHPSISTYGSTAEYDLSSSTSVGLEYSFDVDVARITATIGFDSTEQTVSGTTRLSLIPVGVLAEYVFLKDRSVSPFLGLGALEMVQVQRGSDLQDVTRTDTVPALTAGAEFSTPWNVKIHARVRRLQPLADASKEWTGQIYDAGVAYSM